MVLKGQSCEISDFSVSAESIVSPQSDLTALVFTHYEPFPDPTMPCAVGWRDLVLYRFLKRTHFCHRSGIVYI